MARRETATPKAGGDELRTRGDEPTVSDAPARRTASKAVTDEQLPEAESLERVRNDVLTDPAPIKTRSNACNVPTCTKDEVWFGLCEGHRRSRPGDRTRKGHSDG